ncbi:hypothetical protein FCV25MIE_13376 [Fagus crenata]
MTSRDPHRFVDVDREPRQGSDRSIHDQDRKITHRGLNEHRQTSSVRREISIVHHRGSIADRQPSITHRGLNEHRHGSTLRSWVGSCYGERGS